MSSPEASRRKEVVIAFMALTVMYLGLIGVIVNLAPTREAWLESLWSEVGARLVFYLSLSSLGLVVMLTRARERRWLGWLPVGIALALLLADILPSFVGRGGHPKPWAFLLVWHGALLAVVVRWRLAKAATGSLQAPLPDERP